MRRAVLAVVAILLLAPLPGTSSGPGPAPDTFLTPRPPIVITSDADFTPENGIRYGSGTPEDPFVISDWRIVTQTGRAIHLEDTRSHVLIAHNHLSLAIFDDRTSWAGVWISNATNVTIDMNTIDSSHYGVAARDESQVVVTRNTIRGLQHPAIGSGIILTITGIALYGSSGIVAENEIDWHYVGIQVLRAGSASVHHNTISDVRQGIHIGGAAEAVYINYNHIVDAGTGLVVSEATGGFVDHNVIERTERSIDVSASPGNTIEGLAVTNNTFRNATAESYIHDCNRCQFTHNLFEEMAEGVGIASPVDFEFNLFRNNGIAIGADTQESTIIRSNVLETNNEILAIAYGNESLDLRYNWWGTQTGPDPEKLIGEAGGDFMVEPWLMEPPE